MKPPSSGFHLLLSGVVPRLAVAGLIVAALWLGFVWATSTPGAL
jgi:hypothetical protein